MIEPNRLDPFENLYAVRLQDVWQLFGHMTILELYSNDKGRRYLVVDREPKTKNLYLSRAKIKGPKTTSPLLLLVKKHLLSSLLNECLISFDGHWLFLLFTKGSLSVYLPKNLMACLDSSFTLLGADPGFPPLPANIKEMVPRSNPFSFKLEDDLKALSHENAVLNLHQESLRQKSIKEAAASLKKLERLKIHLQKDLKRCEQALKYSADGEVLKHHLSKLKRGQSEIELIDYYQEHHPKRIIKLDPALSPEENLERIFHQAKRGKRGLAHIEPRLRELLQKIAQQKELIEKLKTSEAPLEIAISKASLKKGKKRTKTPERKPYRAFLSTDGFSILVGRSAKDSDALTFRIAKGNDLWFHARDVPGSHVVVQAKGAAISEQTKNEAALLATHFSKAKGEARAIVQYTEVKNLKKTKGLKAGMVLVSHEKTRTIELDSAALSILLERKTAD